MSAAKPTPVAPSQSSKPPRARWSVDPASLAAFNQALAAPTQSPEWFELRSAAERLALTPGFDTLITLNANTIKELPHQIDVAQRVLRQFGGRALLADEVGLGKTIEAGIVLKELVVRGLARRILILAPAALVDQWQGELESKFFERFDTPTHADEWHSVSRGIASYDRARGKRHAAAIHAHPWDLVIIDEAHKVKNHQSATYKFISAIRRNFLLLLTATPLQNDLRELYNLITLLRPGQLGTWKEFQRQHVGGGDLRRPRNPEALRELTSQVMIRTRRASVAHALELPRRVPSHPSVNLSPDEATLYGATVAFLRGLYTDGFIQPTAEEEVEDASRRRRRTGKGIQQIELLRLCQRLCSSSRALADSLERIAEGELVTPEYRTRALTLSSAARRVTSHAKLDALGRVLAEHTGQVIVFSEHLPTLELIRERVAALGRTPVLYQGGLSREDRAKRLAAFKRDASAVFVSTRAGTEGLNLQFCNVLVNYELPWNPMVVEQRIGRIHRIGQTRDAHIVNLAAEGTIEAHVLRLLDQKIRLFELVVGELDVILGDFGGAESLEKRLIADYLGARTEQDFEAAIEAIGREIVESRESGLAQEQLASEISAEDNAMRVEREFRHLTIPARVRLAYGTKCLDRVRGIETKREQLGLHVSELLEALEAVRQPEDGGVSPEYGPLVRLSGVTKRGRGVHLTVQADRLPMMLVDVDADPEAPLVPSGREVPVPAAWPRSAKGTA
jgi:SNF2 family DNA or RNA helicase